MRTYESWKDLADELRSVIDKLELLRNDVALPGSFRPLKYGRYIDKPVTNLGDALLAADELYFSSQKEERRYQLIQQREKGVPELVGHLPKELWPLERESQLSPNELRKAHRGALVRIVREHSGDMTRVAAALNTSRKALEQLLKSHSIPLRGLFVRRAYRGLAGPGNAPQTESGDARLSDLACS